MTSLPTVRLGSTRMAISRVGIGAWAFGGLIALAGAFVYAELAQRRPEVGGQYAYIRDAFHPYAPAGTGDIQLLRLAQSALGLSKGQWSRLLWEDTSQ